MTAPDTLPPELAELGELLREAPPRPDPAWARALDDRAAAGFPRPPHRPWWARLVPPRTFVVPAMAVASVVVVLVVGISSIAPKSGDDGASSGSSSGAAGGGSASSASAQSESSDSSGGGEFKRDSSGSSSIAPRSVPPGPGGGSASSDNRTRRLQERSAALTLAARPREIETVADGIVRVTDAAGGFVASSSVSGGSDAGGSFELRVPTSKLQKALADLSRLAHVRARTQATRDITAEGVSARGRLTELRKEREGLLRALARATTLNETESIKARLRTVNASIASARSALRRVNNRAAFANVSVTLVADRSAGAAGGGDTWTPGDALHDAGRVLEVAAGIALIAFAILLPLGVLAGLGALASRAATRRRRDRALDAV
jgi:hypothetical protein